MMKDIDLIQTGYMGRIVYYNTKTGEETVSFIGRTTRASGMTPYVNSKVIPEKLKGNIDWMKRGYTGPLVVKSASVVKVEQRVVSIEQEINA